MTNNFELNMWNLYLDHYWKRQWVVFLLVQKNDSFELKYIILSYEWRWQEMKKKSFQAIGGLLMTVHPQLFVEMN